MEWETVMSDTAQRLKSGKMPVSFSRNDALIRSMSRDAEAERLVKKACQEETYYLFPKLMEMVDDERPAVKILAMEAILRIGYGKPGVARLVKSEVERLTGKKAPSFLSITRWPDGSLAQDVDVAEDGDDREEG